MQLTLRGAVPAATSPADAHRLRWIGGYRDKAATLIAEVVEMDLERMAVEERIVRLDARLADPALSDHPLRAAALERRNGYEGMAIDRTLGRANRLKEFARIVGEMAKLIVALSPAGRAAAAEVVGAAATSIDPESDLWRELGMPSDVPDWCVGRRAANVYGWQNRGTKRGEPRA